MRNSKRLMAFVLMVCTLITFMPTADAASSTGAYNCQAGEHAWEETVIREGDCTKNVTGIVKRTCVLCGEYEYESKLVHNWDDLYEYHAATCTRGAYMGYECKKCGMIEETTRKPVTKKDPVTGKDVEEGPLGHVFSKLDKDYSVKGVIYYVEPTCTKAGRGHFLCAKEGCKETADLPIAALGHVVDKKEKELPAECGLPQRIVTTCSVCGFEFDPVPVAGGEPALEHSWRGIEVEATCTTKGYTAEQCVRCRALRGQVFTAINPEAHKERKVADVRPATCSKTGIGKYECELCFLSLGYKVTTGEHTWGEGTVSVAPTCSKEGLKVVTCQGCGKEDTQVISATGEHVWKDLENSEVTCTMGVMTASRCDNCGKLENVVNMIPATSHGWTADPTDKLAKAATCTLDGVVVYVCNMCGITKTGTISSAEHQKTAKFEYTVLVPTCEEPARIVYACADCGYITESTDYEAAGTAMGHSYVNSVIGVTCTTKGSTASVCAICGDVKNLTIIDIDPEAHVETLEFYVKEASCTMTGIGKYVCTLCGEGLGYRVAPIEHNWDAGVVQKVQSCSQAGVTLYTCADCGATKTAVAAATGKHVKSAEPEFFDATCTQAQRSAYYCVNCMTPMSNPVNVTNSKPLGHNWVKVEDYKVTVNGKLVPFNQDPTCTKDGIYFYRCDRAYCGETEESVIGKTGHQRGTEIDLPADCENAARVVATCMKCGEELNPVDILGGEAAKGHVYKTFSKEATCTEAGYTSSVCAVCGKEVDKVVGEKNAENHVETIPNVVRAASCTRTGIGKYECELCHTFLGYRVIEITHTWIDVSTKSAPDCGHTGLMLQQCELCTATRTRVLDKVGEHQFKEDGLLATCTRPAYAGEVCSVCRQPGPRPLEPVPGSKPEPHTYTVLVANYTIKGENGKTELYYQEPTCSKNGRARYACAVCKEAFEDRVLTALGHEWNEATFQGADCLLPDRMVATCSVCGEEGEPMIVSGGNAARGHVYETVIVEANCTTDGYTASKCAKCGNIVDKDDIDKLPGEHTKSLQGVVRDADCSKTGIGKYVCKDCGEFLGYMVIEKTHAWQHSATIKKPNCGYVGEEEFKCDVCGKTETREIAIPADAKHEITVDKTFDATCTQAEYVADVCSICGKLMSEKKVPTGAKPLGHELKLDKDYTVKNDKGQNVKIYVPVTCSENGYGHFVCSVCGEYSINMVITSEGHIEGETTVAGATCELDQRMVILCSVCGYEMAAMPIENAVTATGHSWKGIVVEGNCKTVGYTAEECQYCSAVRNKVVTGLVPDKHVPTMVGNYVKAPTCTDKGIAKFICELCETSQGYRMVEPAHKWSDPEIIKAPTCGETGLQISTCNGGCGKELIETLPVAENDSHQWSEGYRDATCSREQLAGSICSICGKAADFETDGRHCLVVAPALGHTWTLKGVQDPTKYVEATCNKAGYGLVICLVCNEEEYQTITKTAHVENEPVRLNATCTKNGRFVITCSVCGETVMEGELLDLGLKTGHNYQNVEHKPNCKEAGFVAYECINCHDIQDIVETIAADPSAHVVVTVNISNAPTCVTPAIVKDMCSVCGTVFGYRSTYADHVWIEKDVVLDDEPYAVYYLCSIEGCDAKKLIATLPGYTVDCEHKNVETVKGYAPTCTIAGLTDGVVCKDCEQAIVEQEPIQASGHKNETVQGVSASCLENGKTEGVKCSVCNEFIVAQQTITAPGHTPETVKGAEATCLENGMTDGVKCSVCDATIVPQQTITAPGHTPTTIGAIEATCVQPGKTAAKVCVVCDFVIEPAQDVATIDHDYVVVAGCEAVAPTCTMEGKTALKVCKVCGDIGEEQATVARLPHDYQTVAGKKATCTEDGLTEGKVCKDCGDVAVKQEVIKGEHVEVSIDEVAPTCTRTGSTFQVECAVCHAVLQKAEEIPMIDHTPVEVAAVEATCTKTGMTAGKKCAVCDAVLEGLKEVSKKDHTPEEVPAVEATCTKTGLTAGKKCAVCDAVIEAQKETALAAHTPEEIAAVEATCTATGLTAGEKCAVCGAVTKAQEVAPAKGHTESEIAAVAATCVETGLTAGKKCAVCGEVTVAQKVVTAKGHTEVELAAKEATCTATGLTAGKKCADCGTVIVEQKEVPTVEHTYTAEHDWNDDYTVIISTFTCTVCGNTYKVEKFVG